MRVFMRHVDNSDSVFFTECEFDQIEAVLAELKRGGGVYCKGDHEMSLSYQFVLDEDDAYAEIIVGDTP